MKPKRLENAQFKVFIFQFCLALLYSLGTRASSPPPSPCGRKVKWPTQAPGHYTAPVQQGKEKAKNKILQAPLSVAPCVYPTFVGFQYSRWLFDMGLGKGSRAAERFRGRFACTCLRNAI